jgi:site-specific DNA-methyltransferase (adenine-specific)
MGRTPSKALSTRRLARNHDIILAYQMSDASTWNLDAVFTAYDIAALDEKTAGKYTHRDENGRLYQLDNLLNPNHNRPNLTYEFLGVTRVWRWTKSGCRRHTRQVLLLQPGAGRFHGSSDISMSSADGLSPMSGRILTRSTRKRKNALAIRRRSR